MLSVSEMHNKYKVSETLHLTLCGLCRKFTNKLATLRSLPGHKAHQPLWA